MFHCKIKQTVINQETFFANLQNISMWKQSKVSMTDSLVAQSGKNPTSMQESQVRSLGWEDPLEKGMATHNILAWRIPMDKGAWRATVQCVAELDMTEQLHFNRQKSGTTNLSNHYKHSLPIYMDSISKFYCGLPKTLTFTTYFQNLKSC